MLKLVYISILLLCIQSAAAQHFQFGIKGGVNISNFTGGDFEDIEKESLVGAHAGGLVRFRFGETLALQPEVLFSSQGAKLKSAVDEFDARISYINIPVLVQFHTTGGFFFEGGPQVGFKVSEDVPDQTIEDFAESSDLSLALGLGYQTRSGIGFSGRYTIGLSKVGDFDPATLDPDFKNGVIQLGLFFTFFNKK